MRSIILCQINFYKENILKDFACQNTKSSRNQLVYNSIWEFSLSSLIPSSLKHGCVHNVHRHIYMYTHVLCADFAVPFLVSLVPLLGYRKCLLPKYFMMGLWSQDWGPFRDFSGDTNPLSLNNLTHAFMGTPI